MKQDNLLILLIVGLAISNIIYGALCWEVAGFNGLLVGSSFMLLGGIIRILIIKEKEDENKRADRIGA